MSHRIAHRIAVVLHGNYSSACNLIDAGQPETYAGMAHSVAMVRRLVAGCPNLIISLDAPAEVAFHGDGEWRGEPVPSLPRGVPHRMTQWLRAQRVCRRIAAFKPTHLLIRTTGPVANPVLEYCRRHDVKVLAVLAAYFDPKSNYDRRANTRLVELLNGDNVALVSNHRETATQSMIKHGLWPAKAMPFDVVPQKAPVLGEVKALDPLKPVLIAYVGMIVKAKGVLDLVSAVQRLREGGRDVRLALAGDGDDMPLLRLRAGALGDACTILGKVPHEQAMQLMKDATIVSVPSHHSYPEGMPLTLTEAMLNRKPVVVSDHPVMKAAFVDGEGLRFFRGGDADDLARTLSQILDDPAAYRRLSETSAAAYARVECPNTLDDVLTRWERIVRFREVPAEKMNDDFAGMVASA